MRGETAAPEWNEQLSFVELFPPLTRGLRLQLRDDAPLVDVAVATHVLDLRQISHPGRAGERIGPAPAACAGPALGPAPTPNGIPETPLRLEFGHWVTCAPSWPLPSEPHLLPPDYKLRSRSRVASGDEILSTAAFAR